MYHRRFVHLLLAGLMALLLAAPALAVPPETEEFTDTTRDNELGNCGDFDIIENAVLTARVTTFFNNQGDPVRIHVHSQYRGTYMNSVTGKTVTDAPDAVNEFINLQEGTWAVVGLVFSINVPGEGIVVLDAGKVVFDAEGPQGGSGNVLFESGPRDFLQGGFEVLCAALDDP